MKKQFTLYPFIVLFFLIAGCSMGKAPITELKHPQKIVVKDYRIDFEKTISTNFTASGTLRIEKKDNHLLLYDGHVSDLKFSCLDYTTGKELWKASESVWRYYFKNGAVVLQYNKGIEMVELATGKSIWKLNDCTIRYRHPEGSELADQILVIYKEKDAVIDLREKEIINEDQKGLYATYTQLKANSKKEVRGGFVTDNYSLGEDLLSIDVVENQNGEQRIFIWSLNKTSRTYTLSICDKNNKKLKEHQWTIAKNKYKEDHDEYFTGLPEPDKLEPSTYVIGDDLFIFENYTRYRWSWGQGNNRITCIDLNSLELKYQQWGQGPEDKEFHTFLFFNDLILYSDGVMHFQMGDAIYHPFNMENGQVLDSLQQRFTLLEEYIPGVMLGFNYERKQVKGDIYTNKVRITAWDHNKNEYSSTFHFDFSEHFPYEPYVAEDGTIIFTYYDEALKKSILYCCKVIAGPN